MKRPVDLLPGAGLLLLSAIGMVGVLRAPSFWESPDLPLWNGQWGEKWEDELDASVFFHDVGVDAWGMVEYRFLGMGRPGVLVGENHWLYTDEEFRTYGDDPREFARKARLVSTVNAAMAKRGVRLIVAVVPAKARMVPEHLGRYRLPADLAGRMEAFVGGLADVEVVDLRDALAPLGEAAFLRTDTHWTPEGAAAAARTLAGVVRTGGGAFLDSQPVEVTAGVATEHAGDLVRYVPLGPLQARWGPPPDTLVTPTVKVQSGGGLLDEVVVPVTLVGTSYSDDARWGFRDALQVALGCEVLNAAQEGKGPFVSMLRYLDNEAWTASPPQVVIWEIPERYLGVRYDLDESEFWKGHAAELVGVGG